MFFALTFLFKKSDSLWNLSSRKGSALIRVGFERKMSTKSTKRDGLRSQRTFPDRLAVGSAGEDRVLVVDVVDVDDERGGGALRRLAAVRRDHLKQTPSASNQSLDQQKLPEPGGLSAYKHLTLIVRSCTYKEVSTTC